ncbi:MAG TPA: ATP-binding protein [Ferruginibacter sp.]|nr:ATP-binding protein [Ferruginibacter sp.]
MRPVTHIIFFLLSLFSFSCLKAQTKIIDHLKRDIYAAKDASQQLKTVLQLCDQGYSLHPDTLMAWANTALELAKRLQNKNAAVAAMYHQSSALTNKALLDSALLIANSCEEILRNDINDPLLYANVLNQKGRCYVRKNQYNDAIEMGYATISLAEKYHDELLQVKGKTLIGWAYLEMGQQRQAIDWHLKALRTTQDSILLQKYAILFANIATNYNNLDKTDSAFYYIDKAIIYSRKHENLFALSNSLAIASAINVGAGKPERSEVLLKEVVEIRKLIGDPFYTASDLAQLGYYYAHYGQPEKGVAASKEGIELAKKYKLDTKLFFLYEALAHNYRAMGKIDEYGEVLESIIRLKDSVYATNTSGDLAKLNAKYEQQKKQTSDIQRRLERTYWLSGIGAIILLGGLLWYVNYKNFKRKQEQKMALALMEEKRISEKAVLVAQELERKRIAADLHDNLGAYAAAISSNVDNITARENGMVNDVYEELKSNSQSIVSQLNDTIWVLTKEKLALTSISDRLKVFIQKLNRSYPQVQIDVKEKIQTDRMLAPMQALHLFKILQEAIINALRHSNCTKVMIVIESTVNWTISIEDNGTGIPDKPVSKTGGNGLYNMQNRSRDAGWHISWVQNDPAGTRVIIKPTTN